MALDWKSSQEYPVNPGLLQGSILAQHSVLYINDLPGHVICNSAIYVDDTTPCFKCAQASDLQDTVDWERKWLVDCNTGKTQLVSFDLSNNTGSIDVKMDGSVLGKIIF